MPTRWLQAYVDALREQDPKKLPGLREKARRAVIYRILQRDGQAPNEREGEQLEAALRYLAELEWQSRRKPN